MFNMSKALTPKRWADMYDTHEVCIPFNALGYCSRSIGSYAHMEPEEHFQGEHSIGGNCFLATQSMLFSFSFTSGNFNQN